MITIKDIAKEANVSEGTVDRVLHNRGGVSKKTETKIRTILTKHNFKVNPVASALALKNKYTIATLMPVYDADNLFWKSPSLGVSKASKEVANFGVQVQNFTFNQFDPISYLKEFELLIQSKPTAVILVPVFIKETEQIVKQLERSNIPYLFFNIDIDGFNNISFIGQNSYKSGYLSGKLMHLSLGNNASLLVVQTRLNVSNYHAISKRIEGFKAYFEKNNLKVNILTLEINNLKNTTAASELLNNYLSEHGPIHGIFVPSSRISNIVQCMSQNYLREIQLIGFDNTKQNLQCLEEDKISFIISQKPFNQGYESIHIMSEFLVKKKSPIQKIYSPIDILTKENAQYNERSEIDYENENQ